MKKLGLLITFLFLIAPQAAWAENELSEAQGLADDSNQILSELEQATQKGDSARAKALGTVYSQTRAKLDQDTQALRAQGHGDEASSVEETVREGTLKHLDVLKGVRDQVPEEARFGIDRAIEASSRGADAAPGAVGGNKPSAAPRRFNPAKEEDGGGGSPSFGSGFGGGNHGKGGHGGGRPF